MRKAIFDLEDFIKSIPGNGIEESGIQHVHHFAPGIYAREMIVPKDVLMTGAVHRTEHISIFLEGKILVPDGQGGSAVIEAPFIELAQAGIKRVGWTIERVRWVTVHPTDETDVDAIEKRIVTYDREEAERIASSRNVEFHAIESEQQSFISDILGTDPCQ